MTYLNANVVKSSVLELIFTISVSFQLLKVKLQLSSALVKRESLLYSMNSWNPKKDICKEKEESPQRHTDPIQNYLLNSPISNPTENRLLSL